LSSSTSISEEHGGPNPTELRQLGIKTKDVIDFSVNSNPFGPSPSVLKALRQVDISKYPDRFNADLTARLAELNHVQTDQILTGNGTAELIWLVAHAFLKKDDPVFILTPTFGEYNRACIACGGKIIEINSEPAGFSPNIEFLSEQISLVHPRLVFICNPNNPTGTLLSYDSVTHLLKACGHQTILVVDEAYQSFVAGSFFGSRLEGNCIQLRSMTKDFALAGLRLGYAIASEAMIQTMKNFQPAWSVNSMAQNAGLAALDDINYYQNTLTKLKSIRKTFFEEIATITDAPILSSTHFGVIHSPIPGAVLRKKLLVGRIQVRDCTSFGMPDFIRVSTQLPASNQALLSALKDLVNSGKNNGEKNR
jgi:histidinol-phosphate aminotransferase